MPGWPGDARGALCLSFDNLGEAAEIELGAIAADDPSVGRHPTVTHALPSLLGMLGERDLAATFFVEGLNAELYPDALWAIAAAGHEVAYHAWRHEQWGELPADEQAENLSSGIAAFEALGLPLAGLRPPGGQLGDGGVRELRQACLSYASPAGWGAGIESGIALLPFMWRHVDAACVLPSLAPVRKRMTGSPEPLDPDRFLAYLEAEVERLADAGGFATLVLHLPMFDWWGRERLESLLSRLAEASRSGDVWLASCAKIAGHILANPNAFENGTTLDATSWADEPAPR